MQHTALLDGLGFDLLSAFEDGFVPAQADVGRCETAQALVIAMMVVVHDEGRHGLLERPGQVIILEQDAVLHGQVPALDLALCLRMSQSATDVIHALAGEPVGKLPGDVAAAVANGARTSGASIGNSLSSRGRWATVARSLPEATRAGATAPPVG